MIIQILQFVLGLSLLVVLHELGHFIPAVAFKTRVEKFYLFFDPWFSLFKTKIRGTEVGIGWLPLGGYVKISGMVDESMDNEQMLQEPKPYEFRSKPAWQRLIILLGGVTVNVITSIIIYTGMMAYYGETYVATEDLKGGIMVNELGQSFGLANGDVVMLVNGERPRRFRDIGIEILLGEGGDVVVDRSGQLITLPITNAFIAQALEAESPIMAPRMPYIVKGFTEASFADEAGLKVGDRLIALNGQSMLYVDEYFAVIPSHHGESIELAFMRGDDMLEVMVPVSDSGQIGVFREDDPKAIFPITTKTYSGMAAIGAGWNKTTSTLSSYARQVKLMATPETGAHKKAGGFITIFQQYPSTWDWQAFWGFTAFFSLALAFLNILPIPALDGGHAMFVIYVMVAGKPASTKVMEGAQMVGFFILMGLLLLVNGNDVMRLFGS